MRLAGAEGIDPAGIRRAVGGGTYEKGAAYARRDAVMLLEWEQPGAALRAAVLGSGGRLYTAVARFTSGPGSGLVFQGGECTCPVGVSCEHVVAVALAAAGTTSPRKAAGRPADGAWEQSLRSLLEPPGQAFRPEADGVELAIELSLADAGSSVYRHGAAPAGGPRLLTRLVRPGRNGWVCGTMTWGKLASSYEFTDCRPAHVELLKELYALYRSRSTSSRYSYGYGYGEDKTIDLAAFDSRQLWPLLDEAAAIGLQTVHARKRLGAVPRYGRAELGLDVTAGEAPGALVVAPVLRVDTQDGVVVPVRFIGSEGHGVVYVPEAQARVPYTADCPVRLARLATPAPPAVQRMALEDQRLEVPAGARDRFRDEFYPRLRRLAAISSSDGAFTPPTISDPTLVLRASYGTAHELDVSFQWAYEVGDAQVRAPLAPGGADDGYRDLAKESAVLEAIEALLEGCGLRGVEPQSGLEAHAELRGLDTMRFTTEVLPLLAGMPGVAVEVSGEPAAYRESGDTLRIGVSADAVAGETDWFDLGISITVEGREVPFTDVFVALAAGESHLLLADGAYFSLEKPDLRALRGLIEEARALQDAPAGPLRISRFQAGLWDELTELGVVDRQAEAWREQVAGLLSLGEVGTTEPPPGLAARLRPYQRDGFGWLAFLWGFRLGGILADDMGLGKTVQALALICHAKQADPAMSPFLVVAPTSVVANWAAEATRFAPDLEVVTICDTLRRRGVQLGEIIGGTDVVVTSYTLFRLDFEAYEAAGWSGLILDEAQFTKNHQSKVHQCARRLPAPFKLAITGTPMENNLMELWALLAITAPGLFPSPTRFREHYARPIERQSDAELLGRLRRRIKPLVKRRTKEQVAADLPAKQEQVLDVELDPGHRRIYQRYLQRERQKILGLIDDVDRNRFTILRSLTLLRQLSLHPGLVDAAHRNLGSRKVDTLCEQLTEVIDGGHRALVFSQFTGFLGHVRERLDAAGITYAYLDGKTRNRPAVVQRFKDGDAPVFLISLKAGGFGLNLTEADYCFLLDPWWNPAAEAQAVDRTHRIGQTRNVMVYRLIATDTIEEKVLALATRKAELFAGVMDEGNLFGTSLDADDIRELLA